MGKSRSRTTLVTSGGWDSKTYLIRMSITNLIFRFETAKSEISPLKRRKNAEERIYMPS
jgi:hypothetical protein